MPRRMTEEEAIVVLDKVRRYYRMNRPRYDAVIKWLERQVKEKARDNQDLQNRIDKKLDAIAKLMIDETLNYQEIVRMILGNTTRKTLRGILHAFKKAEKKLKDGDLYD